MIKINNKDIVVISPQTWDGAIGSNVRDIAKELAKHNRVLFINRPMDWLTSVKSAVQENEFSIYRKKVLKGEVSEYQQINQNLTVFTPKMYSSINFFRRETI